jgi:hypothetical protein
LHKSKVQESLGFYVLSLCMKIKVQEIRDENMMWNAMEMRHETKKVSSIGEMGATN